MSRLPSISECYALFDKRGTPLSTIRHCLRVNQVAVFIAEALALKHVPIDLELVDRATLLHNLDKHRETTTAHHAQITARLLEGKYPELARAIDCHPASSILDPAAMPKTIEEKVAYYADRRVSKDEIVPMETKLYRTLAKHLLRGRASAIPEMFVPLVRLEQEIFAPLDLSPLDLQKLERVRLNHSLKAISPHA